MKWSGFEYLQTGKEKFAREQKRAAYKKLTQAAPNLFFLAGDGLPIEPLTTGVYEPHVKKLIEFAANDGYQDFLIDIGANIGMTSVQSGLCFKEVHLYEPNPECISILKLNLHRALGNHHYCLYEFGLGQGSYDTDLMVPRGNLGGAFVPGQDNGLSQELLAKKDGYVSVQAQNYRSQQIHIEDAKEQMQELFSSLKTRNLLSGVIKIDVEGYESTVLSGMLPLPVGMRAMIIFECWDPQFDFAALLARQNGRAAGFKLIEKRHQYNVFRRLLKKVAPQCGPGTSHTLIPYDGAAAHSADGAGDLVMIISG